MTSATSSRGVCPSFTECLSATLLVLFDFRDATSLRKWSCSNSTIQFTKRSCFFCASWVSRFTYAGGSWHVPLVPSDSWSDEVLWPDVLLPLVSERSNQNVRSVPLPFASTASVRGLVHSALPASTSKLWVVWDIWILFLIPVLRYQKSKATVRLGCTCTKSIFTIKTYFSYLSIRAAVLTVSPKSWNLALSPAL